MVRNLLGVTLAACLLGGMVGCEVAGGLPEGKLVENMNVPIVVAATDKPVTIDGKLDEAAWKKAVAMTHFVRGRDKPAPVQSRVLVTYDKVNLYVAVINDEPNTDGLVARAKGHDGNVWSDDSVEIYVDPTNSRAGASGYCGFFVNSQNARYDRTEDEAWDPEWTSAAGVIKNKAWITEVAIPFKTLEIKPKPGHRLGLIVARNRKAGGASEGSYLVDCDDEAKDTSVYPVLVLK